MRLLAILALLTLSGCVVGPAHYRTYRAPTYVAPTYTPPYYRPPINGGWGGGGYYRRW